MWRRTSSAPRIWSRAAARRAERVWLSAAVLTLVFGVGARAAELSPGRHRIEPDRTRVQFRVSSLGIPTLTGEFRGATGDLNLASGAIGDSRLDVDVPVASLSTNDGTFDARLKGPDWFDVARFPTITFHSTSVVATGANSADVKGMLSLHGVTRPVVFKARFTALTPGAAGFEAKARIRRRDFGLDRLDFLVDDEVGIVIDAAVERTLS